MQSDNLLLDMLSAGQRISNPGMLLLVLSSPVVPLQAKALYAQMMMHQLDLNRGTYRTALAKLNDCHINTVDNIVRWLRVNGLIIIHRPGFGSPNQFDITPLNTELLQFLEPIQVERIEAVG